jgi:hypothetical protein
MVIYEMLSFSFPIIPFKAIWMLFKMNSEITPQGIVPS